MSELEDVKVGDLLVNEFRGGRNVVKVVRLTPTQIIVENNERYYKRNGRQVGNDSGFYYSYVRKPKNDAEVVQIIEKNTICNVCRKVKQVVDSCSITYEQAIKIKEILNL